MPNRLTPLDFQTAAVEQNTGTFTTRWEMLLRALFGDVAAVASLPAIINRFAFAAQPSLGASDEGYIAFETTYGHLLRWTGAIWEFAPGDPGNGFFQDFAIAPQPAGWKLCDGSATDYLVVGAAALTVAAITPPNLSGAAIFRKSAAAYTGVIDAAVAPGVAMSGTTGNASPGTNASGTHTHPTPLVQTTAQTGAFGFLFGNSNTDAGGNHSHMVDAHAHDASALVATGNSAARPPSVGVLPYFRR